MERDCSRPVNGARRARPGRLTAHYVWVDEDDAREHELLYIDVDGTMKSIPNLTFDEGQDRIQGLLDAGMSAIMTTTPRADIDADWLMNGPRPDGHEKCTCDKCLLFDGDREC